MDGNIHYHEPNNTKWKFNPETMKFYDDDWSYEAPSRIQRLLDDKRIEKAIDKALHYLKEEQIFDKSKDLS